MPEPHRIQRKRTAGWKAPASARYVGRGTRFGNPWKIEHCGQFWIVTWSGATRFDPPNGAYSVRCAYETTARTEAVRYYRDHLRAHPDIVQDVRQALAGVTLMCWCREDQACHADVLLAVTRGEEP